MRVLNKPAIGVDRLGFSPHWETQSRDLGRPRSFIVGHGAGVRACVGERHALGQGSCCCARELRIDRRRSRGLLRRWVSEVLNHVHLAGMVGGPRAAGSAAVPRSTRFEHCSAVSR